MSNLNQRTDQEVAEVEALVVETGVAAEVDLAVLDVKEALLLEEKVGLHQDVRVGSQVVGEDLVIVQEDHLVKEMIEEVIVGAAEVEVGAAQEADLADSLRNATIKLQIINAKL